MIYPLASADYMGIAAVISAFGSILAMILSFLNGRHIQKVEKATNGMKTELVNEVRAASFAAGQKQEKSDNTVAAAESVAVVAAEAAVAAVKAVDKTMADKPKGT